MNYKYRLPKLCFRVSLGYPIHQVITIIFAYVQAATFVAIMTNFVSYVLLKWSYLWFFDRINSYFDESILLIMKVVALATGSLSVAAEIIWKVSAAVY